MYINMQVDVGCVQEGGEHVQVGSGAPVTSWFVSYFANFIFYLITHYVWNYLFVFTENKTD